MSWHQVATISAARAAAANDPDRFLLLDLIAADPIQRNVMTQVLEEVGAVVIGVGDVGVSAAAGTIIGTAELINRTVDATGARIDAVATWVGEALSLGQPSAGPSPKDIEAAAVIGHLAYSEDPGQRALGLAAIKSAADGDYNTARVFLGAAAERNPDDAGLQSAISFLEGKQQI